jgi:tripeptide aminopeptidase
VSAGAGVGAGAVGPSGVPTMVVEQVIARTIEIAAVSAPPLDEGDRTALVRGWWMADGLDEVAVDHVGNVWACVRGGETTQPAVVVAAHLDTVFARDVEHRPLIDGRHLRGPSVGDDSIALAALGSLSVSLPAELPVPVWILATVGEEGLGNLLGVTTALADPRVPVGALVALEGNWLGRVCHVAVGSVRWRVTITGPGGHAWERADAPSAVHVAARAITGLTDVARPVGAQTAINVGRAGGGESINSRAITAWFEVDLRADSQHALDALDALARHAIETAVTEAAVGASNARGGGAQENDAIPVHVSYEEIGRRPAGCLATDHPVVAAAADALRAAGRAVSYTAASTDANAAHRFGIPAVAIGVTVGEGEHTEAEWIDLEPVADGLAILADTVARIAASLATEPMAAQTRSSAGTPSGTHTIEGETTQGASP